MEAILMVVVVIIGLIIKAASDKSKAKDGNEARPPSARVQRLMERIQAQQAAAQPTALQGQFTQPAGGPPLPGPQPVPGTFPAHQQLPSPPPFMVPGRPATPAVPPPPATFQPPSTRVPSYGPPPARPAPAHRPPQNRLPTPTNDLDNRIRKLMSAGNEVGAVRVLCDERDLNIIEAQSYARSLVAPPRPNTKNPGTSAPSTSSASTSTEPRQDEETRYVGSAAFAESIFDTDRDENVWASGWTEPAETDDRTDITELWETVRNSGRHTT
jgi:hypothetical protein